MNQLVSRVLVTVVALPIVLYLVWLGGWWIFALALVAALIALHELYVMARELRPLVLAGYAGAIATLLGAQLGGPVWMTGGFMLTLFLAFVLYGVAATRQTATITISSTVTGVAWIALGLSHLLLIRATARARPARRLHRSDRSLRRRHGGVRGRPAGRAGTSSRPHSLRARRGRGFSPARLSRSRSPSSPSTTRTS